MEALCSTSFSVSTGVLFPVFLSTCWLLAVVKRAYLLPYPLIASILWSVEIVTIIYEFSQINRVVSYLLFGGVVVVFSAQTNMAHHNRLLFKLREFSLRMDRDGQSNDNRLLLDRGVHRYRVELMRTTVLMMKANHSILGQYFVLVVMLINIPVNIVLGNTALWHRSSTFPSRVICAFFAFCQAFLLYQFCAMFARVSTLIHETRACFVPMQVAWDQAEAEVRLRTKMALMVMHEQVNSRKSIAYSFGGAAPITRKTIFKVKERVSGTIFSIFFSAF